MFMIPIKSKKSTMPSDTGATAVLIAISMLLLMGIVAVAIDGGLGFNERRQAQSGADFGALSAALMSSFPGSDAQCDGLADSLEEGACLGAVAAMDVVEKNLPDRVLNWTTCTDPISDPTSSFHSSNGGFSPQVRIGGTLQTIDCIHFSGKTDQARVTVPTVGINTTFARLLGFDTISVSAFAEVEGHLLEETKILPFAIPADFSEPYDCLKTGPNPNWGVCTDLPAVGNFGYADIPVYGIEEMGTTAEADNCNPNNQSLVSNIVRGIDHWVVEHSTGVVTPGTPPETQRDDKGSNTSDRTYVCPVWPGNANEISLQTGVVSGSFEQGMIWGYGPGERGRIWDSGGVKVRNPQGGNPATVVNDEPLWNYLNGSGPASCASVGDTAGMIDCLNDWDPDDHGVIFNAEASGNGIRSAERFAYAPKLYDVFGPQTWYLIEDLLPIYINTTYFGCNSGGGPGMAGVCDVIHAPGETGPNTCSPVPAEIPAGSEPPDGTCGVSGSGSSSLAGVTTFILDAEMLPDDAKLPFSSNGPLIDINLTR